MVKLMDDRGLSVTQFTRVERTDGKPMAPSYNPASDIVNLFPAILSAAINDLEGSQANDTVDEITNALIRHILPLLYEEFPDKDGNYGRLATKLSQTLDRLESAHPCVMNELAHNFLYFALMSYAIACKNGLRSMPTAMGGNGVFRYFAMLGVWDKLSPETQNRVVNELAEQNLWGADPDAI